MARHNQDSAQHNDEQRPDTALGEVLKEFEEAETHHVGRAEASKSDRRAGEAGDALTPNEEAQEDADHA